MVGLLLEGLPRTFWVSVGDASRPKWDIYSGHSRVVDDQRDRRQGLTDGLLVFCAGTRRGVSEFLARENERAERFDESENSTSAAAEIV